MKKKNLKSLQLNKKVVTTFRYRSVRGGAVNITADQNQCPDNTLAGDCGSLGACPRSFWCEVSVSNMFLECCLVL